MSYDLFGENLPDFHTAPFSTRKQHNSTDQVAHRLLKPGVPAEKNVIGTALYFRAWNSLEPTQNGLRQRGVATEGLFFPEIPYEWSTENGYLHFRGGGAKAPYVYHPEKKFFASFDFQRPVVEKTIMYSNRDWATLCFSRRVMIMKSSVCWMRLMQRYTINNYSG
jgi:chitinase